MKTFYKEMSLDMEKGAYAYPYKIRKTRSYFLRRQIGAALVLLFPLVLTLFVSITEHQTSTWDACYKEVKQMCKADAECLEASIAKCDYPFATLGIEPLPSVAAPDNQMSAFQQRMQTEN